MIVCGDFAQLVPIMQHSLMDTKRICLNDAPKEKDRYTNIGKQLMELFNVSVILTKQHRQTGGEYAKLCLKFRDGSFSTEDHVTLQKRNYDVLPLKEKLELENKGTTIAMTNKQAGTYNAKKLLSTAKNAKQKIFRLNAFETGIKDKAVTTSENFSGLKSTIHLTIGARIMITSNLWVGAGLINGAQGIVSDIVFHEDHEVNPSPHYILVEMDEYKGPRLFEDEDKRNWVPIFVVTRRHQFDPRAERQQVPVRLSWSMTGFKVQGLSLFGEIVNYPTPEDSKIDPMNTWGLNYCILTRVPDLSRIAFINLPDYARHMKLYRKSTGKDYFKMFLNFDKRCFNEFDRYVEMVAKMGLEELRSLQVNAHLITPIHFYNLYDRTLQQCHDNNPHISKKALHRIKLVQDRTRWAPQPILLRTDATLTIPQFKNPSNNCWFNAVVQIVIQALKNKGHAQDMEDIPLLLADQADGDVLMTEIRKYLSAGTYDLNERCHARRRRTIKQLMLITMGILSPRDLHKQYDAAQCMQKLLEIAKDLSFLWHYQVEKLTCDDCGESNEREVPNSVVPIQISVLIHDNKFNAVEAIKNCFESTERDIERICPCGGLSATKSVTLPRPPNFLIIQFKRWSMNLEKISAEAEPFSSVEINTNQGLSKYEVIGSVEHVGVQQKQGHYVAYVRVSQNWYQCDDERITPFGNNTPAPIRNAYLLLLKLADD